MFRYRLRTLLIVMAIGLATVFAGFCYDVFFAGIPYQDPTPAMQASYDFHSRIASMIRLVGEILFVVTLALVAGRLVIRPETLTQA
jgi:hypothetical protein